jgi:hypothetical protein
LSWCFHDRIREFTFSDGQVIKMCPDCTQFDAHRREVLVDTGKALFATEEQMQHWETLLSKFDGLSVCSGSSQAWLEYHGCSSELSKFEPAPRQFKDLLYDIEWAQSQSPFPHTKSMPRLLFHFCPHCKDVTIDGVGKQVSARNGVYLPVEHECASVRVYNLKRELLETKQL